MRNLLLLLTVLILSANANTNANPEQADEPWGYTCTNDEVLTSLPSNVEIVGRSNTSTSVIDKKAIKVDRKAGTATVWVTYLAFPEMTADWTKEYGSKFSNLGYIKQLKIFNLKQGKYKSVTSTYYRCNGTTIETLGQSDWGYVVEGSIDDTMVKYLKTK